MFKYKIQIKKVSGKLYESAIPQKNIIIKSNTKKSKKELLRETSNYLLENYGLKLKDARIILENAPRLNGRYEDERRVARNSQTNHYLTRPNVDLKTIRNKITEELIYYVYQYFNETEDTIYDLIPEGIAISMDGEVQLYGRSNKKTNLPDMIEATETGWYDREYESDEKAAENVFTYSFDRDEDFDQLQNYQNRLNKEINDIDYEDQEYMEEYDLTEETIGDLRYEDYNYTIKEMEQAMEDIKSFEDIDKQRVPYEASEDLLGELRFYVMDIMKKYINMNRYKQHSNFGLSRMNKTQID